MLETVRTYSAFQEVGGQLMASCRGKTHVDLKVRIASSASALLFVKRRV